MHRIPLKATQMRRLNPNNSNSNIDEVAWNGGLLCRCSRRRRGTHVNGSETCADD